MIVYPKTQYLKISVICSALIGLLPREFMFEKNQRFQKHYSVFSNVILGFFIMHLTTYLVKLHELLSSDEIQLGSISAVLCTTFLYIITLIRQMIVKYNSGLKTIIKQIIDAEKVIYAQDNQEVINIYDNCVKDTTRNCILYPSTIFITTISFLFRPLVVAEYEKEIGNQTVSLKALPLPLWLPFNEEANYKVAYAWQSIASLFGAAVVSATDILMISLIIYPTVQLQIMQYVLRNFEMYKQKLQAQLKTDNDTAAFVTFRECVRHHNNVIRLAELFQSINCQIFTSYAITYAWHTGFVDYFNDSMSALMTLDFLQSSLQIAAVLAQVLGTQLTPMLIISVGFYVSGMLLRLFLYYHYANEVIVLSGSLALGVWDINWYDQPRDVKLMMIIFMLRAQKSLQLQIGSFAVMSLDSLIAILKATYSYITLIYGTN